MENHIKIAIREWEETKEYVNSLGYELGEHAFKRDRNIVYKKINERRKFIGYIKVGDFDSLEIINKI